MIDKDFETISEKVKLLSNEGYFARYREHLATGKSRREAWEAVEAEMPLSLRRFKNHTSFKNALLTEAEGKLPESPRLTYIPV
jgi:hypothetical protein